MYLIIYSSIIFILHNQNIQNHYTIYNIKKKENIKLCQSNI